MKRVVSFDRDALVYLLSDAELVLVCVDAAIKIPGSYWGNPEAGLIGNTLFASHETPLHSVLHEASHALLMTPDRKAALHTDAGGDVEEEAAVCVLQVLLADQLPGYSKEVLFADMDTWGYSFREGSALDWWHGDAEAARQWLRDTGIGQAAAQTFLPRLLAEILLKPALDSVVPAQTACG